MRAQAQRILPPLLLLLLLLSAWELYVDLGGVNSVLLPAPHAIATAAWNRPGLLWQNALITVKEVVLGLALAVVAGFLLAIAIHLSALVRRTVYPLAVGSQALPFAVLAVPLAFWLGFGILPKLIVIALICFFPVAVSTVDGLRTVETDQLKLLSTLGSSRWQALRFAELPAALPSVLTGARIALVVAWIAAFIAETASPTVGAYAGLGREIIVDLNMQQSARAFAATAVLFCLAILSFYMLSAAERRCSNWCNPR